MNKIFQIIILTLGSMLVFSCSGGTSGTVTFSVSIGSWDFKNVLIGLTSDKDIILTNQGSKDFEVFEITLQGSNPDAFKIIAPITLPSTANPIVLKSKATLTITVRFTSAAPAGYRNAYVNIVHNASNSPKQIQLKGNAVINPLCDYLWAQAWGGDDNEVVEGIATDSANNIYVVGTFEDKADFNPFDDLNVNTTDDVDEHTSAGDLDAYLSKFNVNGVWQWTKTWGGPGIDRAMDVVVDSQDDIYVVGDFEQTVDFNPSTIIDNKSSLNNLRDCYMSKFDSTGKYYWARYWGGNQDDWVYSAAIDSKNNIAVAGKFRVTTTFGSETYVTNGEGDCYVSKFSTAGNFVWTRTWGGEDPDHATAVAFDVDSNVYVAGFFNKTVQFGQGGTTVSKTTKGEHDCFLVKYNSTGSFQWVNVWGGTDNDWPAEVASDSQANVYVVGNYRNTVDFDPSSGTDNRTSAGNMDCYMIKFDTSGNYMFAKTWGNTSNDAVWSVSVDTFDNLYISGEFSGTVDLNPYDDADSNTTTDVDEFKSRGTDCFFSKYDSVGNYLRSRAFGDTGVDRAYEIFIDKSNYILIAGEHREVTDFNPFDDYNSSTTSDVDERTSYGEADAFLSRFE